MPIGGAIAMILPTKGISQERCLLSLGAEVLEQLERPDTLSSLWEDVRARHTKTRETLSFDWFTLCLAFLYAAGLIEIDNYGVLRRADVPSRDRIE